MPTNLTVNNNVFSYPSPGDEPGWGGGASSWASEVTTVLNDLKNPDDIGQTVANIANNQATPVDVPGLLFNTATVRSALIEYSIYILTTNVDTSVNTELSERGQMEIVYRNGASVGNKWRIGQVVFGDDSQVRFTMTDAGQFQYTSANIPAPGTYTGTVRFEARSIQQ